MKTIKVAFLGHAGSGKDWVAEKLRDSYPDLKKKRIAFADELKKDLFCLLKLPQELWSDFLYSEDFKQGKYVDFDQYKIHDSPDGYNLVTAGELERQGGPKCGDIIQIRELCVYYGTMVMQKWMGPGIWIQRLSDPVVGGITTITDVRFPQEYEECKSGGYFIVKVIRDGERLIKSPNIAESYIDEFQVDFTFHNHSDPEKFKAELDRLKEKLSRVV